MSEKKLGVGILGAAAIARKNVKAISKATNGVGKSISRRASMIDLGQTRLHSLLLLQNTHLLH